MYEVKDLEKAVEYIENENNYFACFPYVVSRYHVAKEMKNQLFFAGELLPDKMLDISQRLDIAYNNAIKKHKEWTIKVLKPNESKHTVETLVSTVYHDLFGF